jgi:hypothetical protein
MIRDLRLKEGVDGGHQRGLGGFDPDTAAARQRLVLEADLGSPLRHRHGAHGRQPAIGGARTSFFDCSELSRWRGIG